MKLSVITGAIGHMVREKLSGKKPRVLPEGLPAPNFSASDETGTIHTLEQYRGKRLILWFYPRASTPG